MAEEDEEGVGAVEERELTSPMEGNWESTSIEGTTTEEESTSPVGGNWESYTEEESTCPADGIRESKVSEPLLCESEIMMRIYQNLLLTKKEDITQDAYRNLIINTPHSKLSFMDIAAAAANEEVDLRKKARIDENSKPCNYCPCSEYRTKRLQEEDEPICPKEPKTDFTMRWKPDHCPYLFNDRNYAIMPDIPRRFQEMKTEIFMNNLFFSCFCEKWYNGTRRLILQGDDLEPRIGRRFMDWDVPYLMVFLRSNRDIVSLNLAYNGIQCAGFMNLVDYINAYNHILELNVQNNMIRKPGIDHLCQEGEKLRVKTLRLNGNKFGVESAQQVALLLLKNPYLRYLDVAEVDQTASSLVYFTTVMRWDQNQYNETLKILDISRPNPGRMYFFDTTHFASVIGCMLKFNRCLVELHLQKYSFSCHDIEIMLKDMAYNDTLHLLDLSNNNIGDHGMEHLANWLKGRPPLKGLLLGHNIVTSYGARALSFCMPFSRVRMLDLSYNRITDAGAMDIFNSIKKSTPMRHLRIFGNCIGHCTAKIVERMLVSGVLCQENIDIKPYRVDHKWYFAYYPADHQKQRYYNVPRYAFPQSLKLPYVDNAFRGKAVPKVNFKYVDPVPVERRRPRVHYAHPLDCVCCECKGDEAMNSLAPSTADITPEVCICGICRYEWEVKAPTTFQSEITFVPRPPCTCHPDDCACCYCELCKGKNEHLPTSERDDHPIDCTCCKCPGAQEVDYASSSISTGPNELHDYPDGEDRLQKIALILEKVDSEVHRQILKWVNIDETTLDADLKAAAGEAEQDGEEGEEEEVLEEQEPTCDCWVPFTVPMEMPVSEPICCEDYNDICGGEPTPVCRNSSSESIIAIVSCGSTDHANNMIEPGV